MKYLPNVWGRGAFFAYSGREVSHGYGKRWGEVLVG